jgi:glycosyltransferase involved in cell wall biosynthesis
LQNTHKKVCIVTISLGKGGAERSSAVLSHMLDALGYDVHIAVLSNEIDYPFSGTLFNLGLLKNKRDTIIKRIARFWKLRVYLKHQNFDFIIDHRIRNNYHRELFYANYMYRGFRSIYVIHSSNPALFMAQKYKKMAALYARNFATVAVSEYIKIKAVKEYGISNTVCIPNTVMTGTTNSAFIPEEVIGKKYILSYGRLDDEVKDLTFLIHSFTISEVWKDDVYLIIMGEGKDKEQLQALTRSLPSCDFIQFLPFTKDPFSYVRNAHLVTLTSRFEGFPMVLVESLSVGTPVVSLDIISGPSEIIKHKKNGLIVLKRSLPLFAEAIKSMCFDKELHRSCKEHAKVSVEKYSMEEISKQWHKLLMYE